MGKKQGPCFHCGIDKTPLWRNGPPDKPVLCNACGSRYRLGKPLENYIPKKNGLLLNKKIKSKSKLGPKAIRTNQKTSATSYGAYSYSYSSSALEDHYASSESSTSQYCHNNLHIKQEDPYDINPDYYGGSILWESQVPSRRRSPVIYSSLTTIQRLRRDLHKILKNEDPFNGISKPGPDDVLIYNIDINKLQVPSTEIGLGSILLKFPVSDHSQEQKTDQPPSSRLNDAEIALHEANIACKDNDVDGVLQKEASDPRDLEIGLGNSPTMDAAADSLNLKAKKVCYN